MTGTAHIKSIHALCLLFCIAVGGGAAISADGVTFGDKPTYQSDNNFEYVPSNDKQAFTIVFQGLEVAVDGGKTPDSIAKRARSAAANAPMATKAFSIVIPLGSDIGIKTTLF